MRALEHYKHAEQLAAGSRATRVAAEDNLLDGEDARATHKLAVAQALATQAQAHATLALTALIANAMPLVDDEETGPGLFGDEHRAWDEATR